MTFTILAFSILILFYAIYFCKMFAQKRRGIQTRQIGMRKERKARTVEMLMSVATALIVPVQVVSIVLGISLLGGGFRIAGIAAGFLGDAVFFTAVLTMRDSWRAGIPSEDKTALISDGIYSVSRNPAFLGFDLMYAGICLAYCNAATVICSLFAIVMLHLQILQEEKFLVGAFGAEYAAYKSHVRRYFGRRRRNNHREMEAANAVKQKGE